MLKPNVIDLKVVLGLIWGVVVGQFSGVILICKIGGVFFFPGILFVVRFALIDLVFSFLVGVLCMAIIWGVGVSFLGGSF